MDTLAKPPAPPLTIDMRCGCGACLYVEFWEPRPPGEYFKSEAFFGLARAWSDAHRGCSKPKAAP